MAWNKHKNHIGYIYESEEAWQAVVPAFIADGLARDEKVFCVGKSPETRLRDAGIDVDAAQERGQLALLPAEVYTPGGRFDPQTIIAWLTREVAQALDEGFTALRVTSDMCWAIEYFADFDTLVEYEAQLHAFFAAQACVALCQYDRRRFPAEVLLNVLRTHPHLIVDTEPCDNVCYAPPDKLRAASHAEIELDTRLTNLKAMQRAVDAAHQSAMEVSLLLKAARAILAHREFEDAARIIFDIGKRLTGATSGYVALLSDEGDENEVLFLDSGGELCTVDPELPMPIRGLREAAYRTGQVVYDNHFDTSQWIKYIPAGHSPLHQVMFGPLPIEGKVVGLMGLANKPGGFDDNDARLVGVLGELAAVALMNSRTLEALQAREAWYRALFNASGDAVFAHRVHEDGAGHFIAVNDVACERLGYTREELLARTPVDIDSPERQAAIPEITQTLLAQGHVLFETVHIAKDGTEIPVEVNAHCFEVEGAPVILSVARDITERQVMEEQLRAYTERLERLVDEKVLELEQARAKVIHAGKLASLGEMATGVAHEINQPLTAILFDATYLRRISAPDAAEHVFSRPEVHAIAQAIEEDVDRVQHITQHLRSFGRIAGGHSTTINLNQPIRDSLILVQERLRLHDVTLTLDLEPDLPPIQADPHKLEQVFINLISNAEYALARRAADEPEGYHKLLEISTATEGNTVVARVRDNGCGISEEAQARLFEPFFTTKPVGEGTGLGLSISYGIISEIGGEILCESREGRGTTFSLSFPAAGGVV